MDSPRPVPPARPSTMVLRGIRHHCPRCGCGNVFESWFKLRERCPGCGYRFVREEGFWLGAYVINFGLGEALIGIMLLVFLAYALGHEDVSPVPWLVGGAVLAVLAPIALFPLSRTVWAAVDLIMHPLEPAEEADAFLNEGSCDAPDDVGQSR